MRRRFKPAEFEQLLVGRGLDYAELGRRSKLSHVTIAKIRKGGPVTMATVRRVAEVIAAAPEIALVPELSEAVA